MFRRRLAELATDRLQGEAGRGAEDDRMELEFTAEGATAEAELFIHLDVEGLAALLRAIEAAMSTGRGQLTSPARAGGEASDGFGKVTVTFADRSRPSDDSGPFSLPDPGPARGFGAPVLQS